MGKIKQGVLGGFSGKVGPVIGSSWKGKAYMKGIALSFNDANTDLQKAQRQRFTVVSGFVMSILSFVRTGFRSVADGMTTINACMSYNLRNGITGTYPNLALDFTKLLVADGPIENVYNPSKQYDDLSLEIGWSDNSGIGNAQGNDRVNVLVYCPEKGNSVMKELGARSERTGDIALPSAWSGSTVHVWMACTRGNESGKSVYLGSQVLS